MDHYLPPFSFLSKDTKRVPRSSVQWTMPHSASHRMRALYLVIVLVVLSESVDIINPMIFMNDNGSSYHIFVLDENI